MATMVFVDGGYLDKVLENEHPGKRIDYALLATELAKPGTVLRTYYYHCLPFQSSPPTEDERQRYSAKHKFMKALDNLPRFQVRQGRLVRRYEGGKSIYTQKGVDTSICVDMALLAGKGKFTDAALVSGDSDLVPAVEAVKPEGVLVTLWHGKRTGSSKPSRQLFEVCDERREITGELINRVLRAA